MTDGSETVPLRASVTVPPTLRHGDRLVWRFDQDLLTAAWDAVATVGLRPGFGLKAAGIELPDWWLEAARIELKDDAPLELALVDTPAGPVVSLHPIGVAVDPADLAKAALEAATELSDDEAARLDAARSDEPREADYPLGAHVPLARHQQVTAERLALPPGKVLAWTRIASGPSEFGRLLEAHGPYHVVLVNLPPEEHGGPERRTVGLWAGAGAPAVGAEVRPTLRRLFPQQGTWRYGAAFKPLGKQP